MTPDSVRIARRAAISLPDGVARDEHGERGGLLDERREDLGLGGDEVLEGVGRVVDVDLGGAVLGEGDLRGLGAGADVDGGRLAEAAGDGQQLGGRLADLAAGVVDEDENFSHGCVSPQRNFWADRNSASLVPPSPSSVTSWPCSRGGRLAKEVTLVQAASRPT